MQELQLCTKCRNKRGYKRKGQGFHTAIISHCKECGGEDTILNNQHWKQISAPLKDDLREQLVTVRNKLKQAESIIKHRESLIGRAWDAIQEAGYEDFDNELRDQVLIVIGLMDNNQGLTCAQS